MKQEIIPVLKKLISFPTTDGNKQAFIELFEYVKSLIPEGFYTKEYEFQEKPVLVIANTEDIDLDFVFCTHVDVVPCSKYELTEDGNILHGRGTFDMKGGVTAALLAFLHTKTDQKAAIFLTSDEETGGNCVKELLEIYHPKFAIIPDGGNHFQLVEEEKGRLLVKLSITTKAAHAAEVFKGQNAITTLFDLYQKLLEKYPLPESEEQFQTSICLSMIQGGTAYNQVPDYAEMVFDIRHIAKDQKEQILKDIADLDSNLKIEVLAKETAYETDVKDPRVQEYLEICKQVLHKEIPIIKANATSDGIYFTEHHIPTALMNPEGGFPHAENEFVTKDSLEQLYEIYCQYLKKEGNKNETQ